MVRFHLPPNLVAAAGRDAIPLRVEVDLTSAPAPTEFPVLALLQRWSAAATPPKFIQLTRRQLRELAAAAQAQPFFIENGRASPWTRDDLLAEPAAPASPASSVPIAPASSRPPRPASRELPPLIIDGSEHYLAITLPSREHPHYAEWLDLLKTSGFSLEPSNRKWWLRDRHKTLNFLAAHLTALRRQDVETTTQFDRLTSNIQLAEVACDAVETHTGFTLTLGLRAGQADDAAMRNAVASNRGYVETGGKVYLFDPATLQRLDRAQSALGGEPPGRGASSVRRAHRVSTARLAETTALLEEIAPHFQPPAAWQRRSEALRNLATLAPAPIPAALREQLRPYQRLGVAWLWHLHTHGLGGVLADEMGLGKTLQALGLLSALQTRADSARAPALVTCPASLLENWRRETARFASALRTFVHHGDQRLTSPDEFGRHDLVITSYGTLARDRGIFEAIDFSCVVADEAQHIKNRRSQNARALRALRARGRFLLTGTPLENSLDDLRSLFEFLMPGFIDAPPPDLRPEERAWINERLRARTAPYILRRTKRAVAPELPDKIEQTIWCDLTPAQARLYRDTQEQSERELIDLQASGANEGRLRLATLTQLLRLRQICCDPRLLRPVEADADAATFRESAKLEAWRELLAEAVDDGHRVLVFSQFTSLLALLRAELDQLGLDHCYLDGAMSPRQRQAQVDRFQNSPEIPLFLLSLKAGGTGLNLTGADTVVHFDPWWNPAVEAQATDRAHRIGQTRTVTSYKLICSGTVEEKVLALQAEKRALLAGVFEASDAAAANLSLSDLQALLR
ncbi:DEAD/DEAH box helicase [Horticoccus luteus]|uniref:DEAD/DEAH box helicase n=1 Tax=Horticoccus luteus TaxID=2862869 RepID=A0A8F9TYA6_9BACT|nr:DEAD/DEAH box helicase [Horticoccus luteus]QYM80375.1 DEAD/DEAH box helicase [Horticoccus luteus]